MELKILKAFSSPVLGNVSAGDRVTASKKLADQLIEYKMAEAIDKAPLLSGDTNGKQSSVSQAAQVSQKSKSSTSKKSKSKAAAKS